MITIKIHTRPGRQLQPVTTFEASSLADKVAERVLRGRLTVLLGVIVFVQFVGWLPHYLTWPWWSDHDVFATLALGWDRGVLPYRDLSANNFPGTIYLHWILGRLFGWGWSPALNAVDAGMLLTLGGVVLCWSRRRLGSWLPGMVGFVAYASYYFGLNYTLVGQRDWHGPFIAVTALLVLDGWPNRATRWLSALGLALAFAVRPQVVLFGPAFLLALDDGRRRNEEAEGIESRFSRTLFDVSEWGVALGIGLVLAFLPLVLSGILDDFTASLRHVAFGSSYNRTGPASVVTRLFQEALPLSSWCVPAVVMLLATRAEPGLKRLTRTALVAYAAVALYKPLSPMPAPYLDLPLRIVWSLHLALAVGLVLNLRSLAPGFQLALLLAMLPIGINTRPQFCEAARSLQALNDLRRGGEPARAPLGYTHFYLRAPYNWNDYRHALAYLRSHTSPETRVGNALKHDPAIPGAVGRLPAFSAESLAWIRLVNPRDEPRFVATLERATDSVVVWAPTESHNSEKPLIPGIYAAIERLYEPEARFGVIEVWRRKPEFGGRSGVVTSAQVE